MLLAAERGLMLRGPRCAVARTGRARAITVVATGDACVEQGSQHMETRSALCNMTGTCVKGEFDGGSLRTRGARQVTELQHRQCIDAGGAAGTLVTPCQTARDDWRG